MTDSLAIKGLCLLFVMAHMIALATVIPYEYSFEGDAVNIMVGVTELLNQHSFEDVWLYRYDVHPLSFWLLYGVSKVSNLMASSAFIWSSLLAGVIFFVATIKWLREQTGLSPVIGLALTLLFPETYVSLIYPNTHSYGMACTAIALLYAGRSGRASLATCWIAYGLATAFRLDFGFLGLPLLALSLCHRPWKKALFASIVALGTVLLILQLMEVTPGFIARNLNDVYRESAPFPEDLKVYSLLWFFGWGGLALSLAGFYRLMRDRQVRTLVLIFCGIIPLSCVHAMIFLTTPKYLMPTVFFWVLAASYGMQGLQSLRDTPRWVTIGALAAIVVFQTLAPVDRFGIKTCVQTHDGKRCIVPTLRTVLGNFNDTQERLGAVFADARVEARKLVATSGFHVWKMDFPLRALGTYKFLALAEVGFSRKEGCRFVNKSGDIVRVEWEAVCPSANPEGGTDTRQARK